MRVDRYTSILCSPYYFIMERNNFHFFCRSIRKISAQPHKLIIHALPSLRPCFKNVAREIQSKLQNAYIINVRACMEILLDKGEIFICLQNARLWSSFIRHWPTLICHCPMADCYLQLSMRLQHHTTKCLNHV